MFNEIAFKRQSNKAAFSFGIQLNEVEDDALFDWTGWTATVRIVHSDRPSSEVARGASNGSYVTLPSDGLLYAVFPASVMSGICPGQYKVGLILSNGIDADTVQEFIGSLPVVEGV